ncbi:MAG: Mrp/NBP35 family ATP-binding protein [Chthoniobacterales bacterium]
MTETNQSTVLESLKAVKYPGFSRDIISFGLVKEVQVQGDLVDIQMVLTTNEPAIARQIQEETKKVVQSLPGISRVEVKIDIQAPAAPTSSVAAPVEGVKHIIAVASGKGGVGKSTVAANLAIALQQTGAATGVCDCDLYGPSIAMMFGSNEKPTADEENRIIPIERYGLRLMSMGFLLSDDSPAVLRGPMVTRYTQQFLRQVLWGNLDYLILDLPPGTGDIQLTIVQTVSLAGAVIVTTPQEVALADARKAVAMFSKTGVNILGIVENMSYFQSPSDNVRYDIFGSGGGQREAARLQVPLLGEIPIEMSIREAGDMGCPAIQKYPDSATAQSFIKIAQSIRNKVERNA